MSVDKQQDNSMEITHSSDSEKGYNPKSLENLKPFEKGVSGNPSGRTKKYVKLAEALNEVGDEFCDDWNTKTTYRKSVLRKIWQEASNYGSMSHIKILAELGCLDKDK